MIMVTFSTPGCIYSIMKVMLRLAARPVGILLLLLVFHLSFAQRPDIRSVNRSSGSMSEVLSITGSNFGTNASNLAVYFGAVKASIVTVTDQLLEVQVPPGTTYRNIAVTNTTTGLTGYSENPFLLSFSGKHPFNTASLSTQSDFDAEKGLYDHCLCDLDNDGKPDIATANNGNNNITILRNTSTVGGSISFTKIPFALGTFSLHVRCGDLNGDGKQDLVVTEGTTALSDRVFVLQNTSSGPGNINFNTIPIKLTGRKNTKIEIADLDLNGKPEVLITDQGSSTISILVNQSSVSTIAFDATPINLTIPSAASTDGIAVEDLNGDSYPEIVTSQFQTATSNLFIIENKSTVGTISLGTITTLPIGNTVKRIRIGDLDNDGKKDIAVTQLLGAAVSVFLNQSSSSISFGTPKILTTEANPWGLDFGDIDGDGNTDIVVASVTQTKLTILNNESTPGNLSFVKQTVNTTYVTRHVRIGDLDGDGKPDLSFTSIDNASVLASKVSVFRNTSCVFPVITPKETPLALCTAALPFTLKATVSNGAYYEWKKNGIVMSCGLNQSSFAVTAASGTGTYTVRILAEGSTCSSAGTCGEESDGIDITISAGSAALVNPINNGPVCIGSTLKLSLTTDIGASYKWTGPNGYSATGANPPDVSNFSLDNAGRYYVDVIVGTCFARRESTLVEAINVPTFSISPADAVVLCQGDPNKSLSVVPNDAAYTYQWFKDGTSIATGPTYSVTSTPSSSGSYTVKASNAGCSVNIETAPVTVSVASSITAAFTAPASACAGQNVKFTNTSTSDASATTFYSWNFGDGKTSADKEPEHIFTTATSYNVALTVSYKDNACANTVTVPITITTAPPVAITNPSDTYTFCEGSPLLLEVNGSFTSYTWSTGASTSSIEVTTAGTYTVDVTASNGCVLTASRTVQTLPATLVVASATPDQINEGESSQLSASGLDNYTWEPAETLSNATIANPVATPLVTTTYTVKGLDSNGCQGSGTVVVKVASEAIVNKLKPGNFISPNNDGPNELWVIENIQGYPQCGIVIYDDKGVKVFDAKPYQNNWDGTFNGKKLPDGVYYYIIRCDGEEGVPRAGSITLIR
ncbi:MAG TPA: FG-GAP-like repeat-containing protein [Ohtaekwangia sp.]|uniref:FG-GAP-like repeat-containing protein n=1 Tax=Ohtaekwangia sp. TaxID=2066019 RepID=UPI002F94FCB9